MNFQTPISTIMTTPVECVDPQDNLLVVKHLYERQKFHRHFPVTDKDVLVGMVSLVDYMHAIGDATLDDNEPVYSSKTVEDIMTRNPVTANEDASIAEVGNMLAYGEFNSVVILKDNFVSGIVTSSDLIRFFLKQQE